MPTLGGYGPSSFYRPRSGSAVCASRSATKSTVQARKAKRRRKARSR